MDTSLPSTDSTSSSAAEAADALINARIVKGTKHNYEGKINAIQRYYSDHLHTEFKVPLKLDAILSFFGWLTDIKHKEKPQAFSTVRLYKSALMWFYKEEKVVMEEEVEQRLEMLLRGYKRKVSDLKQEGKMPVFEGKFHLTYDGYCVLANTLFKAESTQQMLFGWPFLVLQWNLIARTATVSRMMMEHIGWEGDSLLVSTPKHKGDQEGVKCFSRHLYANPLNPIICPVLALAVLTFTRVLKHDPQSSSTSPAANYRIFDGGNNEGRYSEIISKCIASLPASDLPRLGGDKKQLGTHSVRKGAASYCAGMINGPSTVQVFLRAGWSLGNVQDRYLFAGAGGDQLTGRVLSGLPFNESSFAMLPPHFDTEGVRQIEWASVLPLYSRLPETFKRALPYLLASICYHEDWLRSNLPVHHALFSTYLFASDAVDRLKPRVVAGRSYCTLTRMSATGIPPHLAMTNELTNVVAQTQILREQILSKCTELPSALVDVMLSKFSINGAIPVTMDNLEALLNDRFNQMKVDIRNALPPCTATPTSALHNITDWDADPRFHLWTWGEQLHMVPQGWKLPSTDVKSTWNLWYFGHVHDKIRPLHYLKKADLAKGPQITQWSKANGVMKAIAQVMVDMKLVESIEQVKKLSAEESSAAFDRAIVELMERVKKGSTTGRRRWMEMSISTLYDHICHLRQRNAKRKRAEREEENEEKENEEEDDEKEEEETEKEEDQERQRRRRSGWLIGAVSRMMG